MQNKSGIKKYEIKLKYLKPNIPEFRELGLFDIGFLLLTGARNTDKTKTNYEKFKELYDILIRTLENCDFDSKELNLDHSTIKSIYDSYFNLGKDYELIQSTTKIVSKEKQKIDEVRKKLKKLHSVLTSILNENILLSQSFFVAIIVGYICRARNNVKKEKSDNVNVINDLLLVLKELVIKIEELDNKLSKLENKLENLPISNNENLDERVYNLEQKVEEIQTDLTSKISDISWELESFKHNILETLKLL